MNGTTSIVKTGSEVKGASITGRAFLRPGDIPAPVPVPGPVAVDQGQGDLRGPAGRKPGRLGIPGGGGSEGDSLIILINEHKEHRGVMRGVFEKLKPLEKGKARAAEMALFVADQNRERAVKLRKCGSYLRLRDYYEAGQVRLRGGEFCHQPLLCPLCARLRGAKAACRYFERLIWQLSEKRFLVPFLLTLTERNGTSLGERLGNLRKGFGVVVKAGGNARRRGSRCSEFAKIAGGVASIEIKRGAGSGLWHPHIHAVVLVDDAIDLGRLRAEWAQALGQETASADLRPLQGFESGVVEDLRGDILEVFKYAVKFGEMSLEDNWHAFQVCFGRRLLIPWGVFWGVKVPENLLEDEMDDELFRDFLARWDFGEGSYRVTEMKGGD